MGSQPSRPPLYVQVANVARRLRADGDTEAAGTVAMAGRALIVLDWVVQEILGLDHLRNALDGWDENNLLDLAFIDDLKGLYPSGLNGPS